MAQYEEPELDGRALFAQLAKMIRADDPQQLHDNADAWLTLARGLYSRAADLRAHAAELARLWPDSTGTAVTTALGSHIGALEREAGTYQHNYAQVHSAAAALAEAQTKLSAIEHDPSTVEAKAAEAQKLLIALDGDYQSSHTRIQDPKISGQVGSGGQELGTDQSQPDWVSTEAGQGLGHTPGAAPDPDSGGVVSPPSPVVDREADGPVAFPPVDSGTDLPRHQDSDTGLAGGGDGGFGSPQTFTSSGPGGGTGGLSQGSTSVGASAGAGATGTTQPAAGPGGAFRGPGQPGTPVAGAGRPGPGGLGGPGLPGGHGSGVGPQGSTSRRRDSLATENWLAVDNHTAPAVLGGRRKASDDTDPEALRWQHEDQAVEPGPADTELFDFLGISHTAGPHPYGDELEYIDDADDAVVDEQDRDWRDGLTGDELAAWSTMTGVRLAGPARD
ncbi:hypothetical protein [Longispora urticae]